MLECKATAVSCSCALDQPIGHKKQALMPQLWQLRESKLRELPVSGAPQDKSSPLRSIQSPILQQQAKLSWLAVLLGRLLGGEDIPSHLAASSASSRCCRSLKLSQANGAGQVLTAASRMSRMPTLRGIARKPAHCTHSRPNQRHNDSIDASSAKGMAVPQS